MRAVPKLFTAVTKEHLPKNPRFVKNDLQIIVIFVISNRIKIISCIPIRSDRIDTDYQ